MRSIHALRLVEMTGGRVVAVPALPSQSFVLFSALMSESSDSLTRRIWSRVLLYVYPGADSIMTPRGYADSNICFTHQKSHPKRVALLI